MSGRFPCSPRVCWLGLIGLAMLLRLGVMLKAPERLTEDRDLYLGIAHEMQVGHGYATPGSVPPRATAFRPPLYPLILVLTGGGHLGIGGLHLLLACVMVVATGLAAERMAGRKGDANRTTRLLAGVIVAVDPLLVLYSGQPMTETFCSCLTAVLLFGMAGVTQPEAECHPESIPTGANGSTNRSMFIGLLWGLCLLARPTYAAALGLWLAGSILIPRQMSGNFRDRMRRGVITGVVALAVLSPWVVRNWSVFGHPIATTTHGGYTLWLANNPVYYAEVVEGGDTAWSSESLNRWQTETNREMDRLQIQGEVAQDHWQGRHAREFIQANPWRFVWASLYRATRFWSVWPGREGDSGLPTPVLWIIAGGYVLLWIGGALSAIRAIRQGQWHLLLCTCNLILGFFAVHLVYWTDARMRAPIMPAVAILLAASLSRQSPCSRGQLSSQPDKEPSA